MNINKIRDLVEKERNSIAKEREACESLDTLSEYQRSEFNHRLLVADQFDELVKEIDRITNVASDAENRIASYQEQAENMAIERNDAIMAQKSLIAQRDIERGRVEKRDKELEEFKVVKEHNKALDKKIQQYEIFFETFKQILREAQPNDTGKTREDPSPTGQPGIFG